MQTCLACGGDEFAYPYWNPESHWDDHPDYPTEDWTDEVINGDTRQSYIEWVNSRLDDRANND